MFQASGKGDLGSVKVFTSNDGGHSPETMADMAMNKIMTINEKAPPPIRDQAVAYRNNVRNVILTIYNRWRKVSVLLFGLYFGSKGMKTWPR